MLVGDDDAQGQSGVHHRVILLHGWHIDDDEGLPILGVDPRGLLLVQGGPEEGGLHAQRHRYGVQLVLAGIGQVHPAAVLHGIQPGHFSLNRFKNREQRSHAFLGAGPSKGYKNPRTHLSLPPVRKISFLHRPSGDTACGSTGRAGQPQSQCAALHMGHSRLTGSPLTAHITPFPVLSFAFLL